MDNFVVNNLQTDYAGVFRCLLRKTYDNVVVRFLETGGCCTGGRQNGYYHGKVCAFHLHCTF